MYNVYCIIYLYLYNIYTIYMLCLKFKYNIVFNIIYMSTLSYRPIKYMTLVDVSCVPI